MRPRSPWPRTSPGSRRRCASSPAPRSSGSTWTAQGGRPGPQPLAASTLALESTGAGIEQTGGKASTFHEIWVLEWQPEFAVAVIEANVWGNTVESAATARIVNDSQSPPPTWLPSQGCSSHRSRRACLRPSIRCWRGSRRWRRVGADVRHLIDAAAAHGADRPLRRRPWHGGSARPADPRGNARTRAGRHLAAACSALDDDAAVRMVESMAHVD